MATETKQAEPCRAIWYHGQPRGKHVCHRDGGHRGDHHADSGLTWARHPHNRRARVGDDACPDCEPVSKALEGAKR